MKKFLLIVFFLTGLSVIARADHITGGEMFYTFKGSSNGLSTYSVTLKLYMRCNSGRQFNNPNVISIFDKETNTRISDISVRLANQETIKLNNNNPCITDPPDVCYVIGYYYVDVTLPQNAHGYVLSSQVNYRIANISNLAPGYGLIGATYTADIPGTQDLETANENNSAHFVGSDLVMVCSNNPFTYSFAAEDTDGDQLQYSFCGAYQSGTNSTNSPPVAPPYKSVPYGSGFTSSSPLGDNVHIDPNTGLLSGIAPPTGVYVVTVCVEEIRDGKVIATQRKDLQIFIAPCTIASADIPGEYLLCKDTKTIFLSNGSTSPMIHTYNWELTDASGNSLYSSTDPSLSYTFPDTGIYKIRLAINKGDKCSDSATAVARVYPGFVPNFTSSGICFTKPSLFKDSTTTVFGQVNSWSWNFGESTSLTDVSDLQNPAYTYPSLGPKNIVFIVANSKGCRDTVAKTISIVEKPPIVLAFRDTLICVKDLVQLNAAGSGVFSWTPAINIAFPDSADPVVSPSFTTTYQVHLNDNGCLNTDSVKVRVTDHVDLSVMNDSTICQGDAIKLTVASNAFRYVWTPASQLDNASLAQPIAITNSNTTYHLNAYIGGCSATAGILIKTVPYPKVNAGADTLICYGTAAQLNALTDGSSFTWSPLTSLTNPGSLSPVAKPSVSTFYVLSAYDTKGCPKPGKDTVLVSVLPKINALAGKDTSVVVNQPLQLNASGGSAYQWIPAVNLSSTNVANPVAVFTSETEFIRYKVLVYNQQGCVDSAFLAVKVFKTVPSVFVPTGFTPNSDGRNDVLRPIAVGMQRIDNFSIYNRWGQLVFTTNVNGKGWDGKVNGQVQETGTFIWLVKAVDYRGASYLQKGFVTLIR